MKYTASPEVIPQDRRAEINEKILMMIDTGNIPETITKEDIFNAYTGVGGLHGLKRADYDNYYEFSEDKKEIEQGQFFTHTSVVDLITRSLRVTNSDLVCDLSCGAGAFFNAFNETHCYGCDIDHKAIRVAKFLYPEAHIDCIDIRYYKPTERFDFVVGNPPFNLKWELKEAKYEYRRKYAWDSSSMEKVESKPAVTVLSQHYFCMKAAELMKPGGILICIVPDSYLKDEFFNNRMIHEINEQFSFLFQYNLSDAAFENMGVASFNTKVICFQKQADSIEAVPYSSVYIQPDEADAILSVVNEGRITLRAKLHLEYMRSLNPEYEVSLRGVTDSARAFILEKQRFTEKVKKYIYEIRHHKILQPYLPKALAKVEEFKNQKRPDNMDWKEWDKIKLTENKVLGYLKRIINKQSVKEIDTYKFVKDNYGFHYKAYSRKAVINLKKIEKRTHWSMYELVYQNVTQLREANRGERKLIQKKRRQFEAQTTPIKQLDRSPVLDEKLKRFAFYNAKGEKCKFNEFQLNDLGLIFQKQFGILNWQMGAGKTAASAFWTKLHPAYCTFVVSPALAIEMTWEKFMKLHNKSYVNVKCLADIDNIQPGMFVLLSTGYLTKYKRQLKKFVKMQCQNVNFVFDESDEITNPASKRTQAVLDVFRRVKHKLLATGTTTRNNIGELYSQLELLYNNSYNMMSECQYIWMEKDKKSDVGNEGDLVKHINPYWNEPFPAKAGALHFKRCFNPAKTTVFGIQKQNQDLFNETYLRKILEYTIITKKFKEIAGDKYTVKNVSVKQNESEIAVYTAIIEELNQILPLYFTMTGNSRKDAALRLLRQLTLLIDATSMPQLFREYESLEIPNKALEIFKLIGEHPEKIAIGCTSIKATEWYTHQIRERFPGRAVFEIQGDVNFKGREKIRKAFEDTKDGILVATQQSLKSSVNIPTCSKVIIESKQWNIPKIEQFFFRFIRYDSPNNTDVIFVSYENTIEMNLMALLMSKERLNDYIKTLDYKENSDIYQEYDIDLNILESLITKEVDDEGRMHVSWGKTKFLRA